MANPLRRLASNLNPHVLYQFLAQMYNLHHILHFPSLLQVINILIDTQWVCSGRKECLTRSFLPMDLLWERERLILKNKSFFVAERGGDDVLDSRPLGAGRGGDDMAWSRPPDRLSTLGEELTVLDDWPEKRVAERKLYIHQRNAGNVYRENA